MEKNELLKNVDTNSGAFEKLSLEKYDYLMGNLSMEAASSSGKSKKPLPPLPQSQPNRIDFNNVDRIDHLSDFEDGSDDLYEINKKITQQERDEVIWENSS